MDRKFESSFLDYIDTTVDHHSSKFEIKPRLSIHSIGNFKNRATNL